MQTQGGTTQDGYPRQTGSALADKNHSKKTTGPLKEHRPLRLEHYLQAHALIELAAQGHDAEDLMEHAISQIKTESLAEGSGGGPYPIGSSVKVTKSYTAEKVGGGGSASVKRGDVVSVIQHSLGETGTDRMVMLSDGSTRLIVPLNVLGEQVGYYAEAEASPSAFMTSGASGKQASKDSTSLGQSEPKSKPEAKGSSTPTTVPSKAQGQSEPKDDKSAQPKGASKPSGTVPGTAVEARSEILQHLDMMMEGASDSDYRRMNEVRRRVESLSSYSLLSKVHEMIFSETSQYSLRELARVVEQSDDANDDNGKKKSSPFPMKQQAKDEADDSDDDDDDDKSKKKPSPPPFMQSKKDEDAAAAQQTSSSGSSKDPQTPQAKPGKPATPPGGVKESIDESAVRSKISSIFTRFDS
jgi:hypothetical protein